MARKRKQKEQKNVIGIYEQPRIATEKISINFKLPDSPEDIIDEKYLLDNGWVFLKIKGDKKVFVKDRVRKQIDI